MDTTIPHLLIALVWFGGLGASALILHRRAVIKARAVQQSMDAHPAGKGR